MKSSLSLGKFLGIPIALNLSWFVSFGMVVLLLGWQIYPVLFPQRSWQLYWLLAMLGAVLFFVSILLHELAHSLVALRLGIPVKGITLFIFGGVSRLGREPARPMAEFVMALIGPLTSFVLAGLFLSLWGLTEFGNGPLPVLWQWLAFINLGVGVFNLAPGFPMDGGRLLRSFLWGISGDYRWATRLAVYTGRGVAYLLIGAGLLTIVGLDWWPLSAGPWQGLWLLVIGLFLDGASRQSYLQAQALDYLSGRRATDVLAWDVAQVERGFPLPATPSEGLLVVEDGRVVGVVLPIPNRKGKGRQPTLTAGEAMVNPWRVPLATPQDDLATLLERMDTAELSWMPVVEEGHLVGVVRRERIVALLRGQPFWRS